MDREKILSEKDRPSPENCTAEQAMKCRTERKFQRSRVYCTCLGDWFQQKGYHVIPWTLEAPTETILHEGIERFHKNRPASQLNPRKEENVADSRWVGHF